MGDLGVEVRIHIEDRDLVARRLGQKIVTVLADNLGNACVGDRLVGGLPDPILGISRIDQIIANALGLCAGEHHRGDGKLRVRHDQLVDKARLELIAVEHHRVPLEQGVFAKRAQARPDGGRFRAVVGDNLGRRIGGEALVHRCGAPGGVALWQLGGGDVVGKRRA